MSTLLNGLKRRRFVLALDYGTTYTGVAYATPESDDLPIDQITLLDDWGPRMGNHKKIPSVISFSPSTELDEQQWGIDLSDNAVAMVYTKMELESRSVLSELDLAVRALEGMKNLNFEELKGVGSLPEYSTKSAEVIVTDYLQRAFTYLSEAVEDLRVYKNTVPTDIVVTIPTNWSYRAKNATYRAVVDAGFNKEFFPRLDDFLFVTEPEAAAIYTARYLKEDQRVEFLKPGEYFILCDAGGGTVDVVSYRVKQVDPSLKIERVATPTGESCGSTQIDKAFKKWLRELLGDQLYQQLDENSENARISSHTTQGRAMRKLMADFDDLKKGFDKGSRDMHLDLPEPLNNLDLEHKVQGGQIIISKDVMTKFFRECISKILPLIMGQVRQIDNRGKTAKNVFLVGGFGDSKYLQEEIKTSLHHRRIKLRVPETSWTAVVRGAVLCGVEKETMANLAKAKSCPKRFAIAVKEPFSTIDHDSEYVTVDPATNQKVVDGHIKWLFKKGELILSNYVASSSERITITFSEQQRREGKITIYSYVAEEDDEYFMPKNIRNSKDDFVISHELSYSLMNILAKDLEKAKGKNGAYYYTAVLDLKLKLGAHGLTSTLYFNDTELAENEIQGRLTLDGCLIQNHILHGRDEFMMYKQKHERVTALAWG